MAGPIPPPSWLFPSISSFSRLGDGVPPTWHVVFIYPMEDTERVAMMTKLSSVDKEWTGRPQTEMRRLVEIPWLIMDWSPPTSVIFTIWKEDPLIFIDGQSQIDHTAIIVWKSPGDSSPEAARVPIGRANMLLGIAASIGLSSDYPRILPERKEETANKVRQPYGVDWWMLKKICRLSTAYFHPTSQGYASSHPPQLWSLWYTSQR